MRTHKQRLVSFVFLALVLLVATPALASNDMPSPGEVLVDLACDLWEAIGGSCEETLDGDDDPDPEIGPGVIPGG